MESCVCYATLDALGKVVVANTEIPAGVIVALIGAPYFLYLLIKSE
ncbi:iron chelate uptake ABC transporter family permease subunit [Paenibacillus pseudetheri]|nr:iron chelate uptake ABC transporter family permease subunit [Paenibacillus pseudetheri]